MPTIPSAPITEISAPGHATSKSGSYARPAITKYPAPYPLRTTTVSLATVADAMQCSIFAPWRMIPSCSTLEPTMKPGTSIKNTSGTLNASHS